MKRTSPTKSASKKATTKKAPRRAVVSTTSVSTQTDAPKFKTNAQGATRQAGVAGSKDEKRPARYDLISTIGLRRLAETCGEGSVNYGDDNWLNGMEDKDLLNHAMAHLDRYRAGDKTEDHLAHAAWNLFAAMHMEEQRPDLCTLAKNLPAGMTR